MKAVVGLLLMLLRVSHVPGVEIYCDGRQDGAQCYGALGGTVVLRLMDSASEITKYRWKFNTTVILNGKTNRIDSNLIANRSVFTPSNGTFRINDLSRTDGGVYTLETFDSSGKSLEPRTLQLFIQAPVSSVRLVTECLSQGEMRASCSSEGGDSPQYSWTLGGRTLTHTELLSGNHETNNITLKQHVSGRLVCSVKNNVSHVSKEETISNCGFIYINCTSNGTHISQWVFAANNTLCIEPTTAPTTVRDTTVAILQAMAGALAALVILLVVGVAVIYAHKKKKSNEPQEEADDQELTYADVRILQRQRGQVKQREEVEVEYGQVKFSQRSRQPVEPTGDNCVYAMVRR
ncbi:leucine-rich repeats and immunoglobulin-like domains protein 1 isoform X3 [Seriola aureovittata]|uniref:leucine-rich repeats and immunoglobulin-like domains protein 1 isoform X3 n=1 Tax=Seriola aureovittata TaxID=2871759 RepID=UPI0024BE4A39|nr:leucine-rich repeats and immunoglobulin-like domains protein 1 isoform X3 [Seriola aureovittata]